MKNKRLLLLKTFLTSTSARNTAKYSKDEKRKKNKNTFAYIIIDIMILVYGGIISFVLGANGAAELLPTLCATLLTLSSFFLTLIKSNGYLFGFKEYDMIVSMPFKIGDIIAAKFLYMFIKTSSVSLILSFAMYIGYVFGKGFNLLTLIAWIILTFAVTIVPMILASALGAFIVRIGTHFRHKNIIQTILILIVCVPLCMSGMISNELMDNGKYEALLNTTSNVIGKIGAFLPGIKWFSTAINDGNIVSFILLVVVSLVIYELFFLIASRSYRTINSKITSNSARKTFAMREQKQRTIVKAIMYKEFRRMLGSSTYMVNLIFGCVLALLLGISALFIDSERMIQVMAPGLPMTSRDVLPAMLMLVYMYVGMLPATCCAPSLEGKNYWIMQSLPISKADDCKGKWLFAITLIMPFGIFSVTALSISFGAGLIDTIFAVLLIIVQSLFAVTYGLRCGLKHRKLDWENEAEVVKQGPAVATFLFPNMFATMFLIPLTVIAKIYIGSAAIVYLILIVIYGLLAFWSGKSIKKYA